MEKGSSICTAMSSMERKMKLTNSMVTASKGCGLSAHHSAAACVPNSENVFARAKGSNVSHSHRKRTE